MFIQTTNIGVDSSNSVLTSETLTPSKDKEVSFDWAVSGEENSDKLSLYVNNRPINAISGSVGWEPPNYMVEEYGEYAFKWIYFRNSSISEDGDYCRVHSGSELEVGDVNSDGIINAADALLILRRSLGAEIPDVNILALADIDGNGALDTSDALLVLQIALGTA